jgi:hypothetical protein
MMKIFLLRFKSEGQGTPQMESSVVNFEFAGITFIPAALLIGVWFVSQLFHAGAVAHAQTG